MGVHTMTLLKRLYQQACEWWDEYYTDNPIAWRLTGRYSSLNRVGTLPPSEELRELIRRHAENNPELAQRVLEEVRQHRADPAKPVRFWGRHDRRWMITLWCIALLIAVICFAQGWTGSAQQGLLAIPPKHIGSSAMAFVLFGSIAGIYLANAAPLYALLVREHAEGTAVFLWLTRLTGQHLIYGAITALFMRLQVRGYLVYVAPFMWAVGALAWDSGWRGIWFAVQAGWLGLTSSLFWLLLNVFLVPKPRDGAASRWSESSALGAASFLIFIFAISSSIFLINPSLLSLFKPVNTAPLWSWFLLPVWWISLVPPVGLASLLFVRHPLWGIMQGLVYLGLAAMLLPRAIRVARERLRPQAEVQPDEGDW